MSGLLSKDECKVWAAVPSLVEFVFNAGRDGWTNDMIQKFEHLSWRYCILMEEHYGTQACVINLHNLSHFHEDISRFSAPDNYWCTQFERAVSRYVQQSSNRKHLEKNICKERVSKRIPEVSTISWTPRCRKAIKVNQIQQGKGNYTTQYGSF